MGTSVDKLAKYVAKRDFSRTAEPKGSRTGRRKGRPLFIVQKHDATRLHFDFRLEWEGALLSWAVTRGPSADPSAKRLAVRTEDHPLDYAEFEGAIPKGQYGGGTVMLWDRGWWEPQGDFQKGLSDGKLKFVLHGERMKGGWALVRMRGKNGESRENWLLIKERDPFVQNDEDGLTGSFTTSVASGRGMHEIAEGKKTPSKPETPQKRNTKSPFRLARPAFRNVQLARLTDDVPEGDDWLHETKFDGYRCLAALGMEGVALYTRSGLDWADRYKDLPEAFAMLQCDNALIDGEVVSGSSHEGSSFSALQRDLEQRRPVFFMAFDLLELNGKQLIKRPLIERKAMLEQLLAGRPENSPLHYSEHVRGNGRQVFAAVEKAGGEGIISKSANSFYTGTRNGNWLKIKTKLRQEFIIGGWSPSKAKDRPFASLLVGSRENGKLHYRGRVGGGFGGDQLASLWQKLRKRSRKTSPFHGVPPALARSANWVKPDLVAEIRYAELTGQDIIRHGVFEGLREDKEAAMVKLEAPAPKGPSTNEYLGVRISNADRVVFPDAGCTKGDVAAYYAKASDRMLELAGHRPVSLLRCPEGRMGDCFFQKHAGKGFPQQIDSVDITESSGKSEPYMVVSRKAGFVAAAQMGAIEFHIWGSRTDKLEKPDRLVFDIDPDEGLAFSKVINAASELRTLLSDIGLESLPMVTGGKGVHVIVSLRRLADWETVTAFARTIAAYLAEIAPDRYVSTMSKEKRKGKIFIDWLRNDRGSTAITPYSIRARKGAPVAMPVSWDELAKLKSSDAFDMTRALDCLEKNCPLRSLPQAQSLSSAVIEALEKEIALD